MKTRVDDRLRAEAARFAFRFSCDDCAHFAAAAVRCSLGYPAAPRREDLELRGEVELCKEYELA